MRPAQAGLTFFRPERPPRNLPPAETYPDHMRHPLLLAASLLVSTTAFATDVEHAFQAAVQRGKVQRVVIDIPTGSFTVRNGAADRIALSGIVSRDYDSAKEKRWAQEVVNDTSVEIYVNGAEAVVRRKFGRKADGWRARKFSGLDLRIELPPGIDVEFETAAGEVDISGTYGDIDIDLRAGEVELRIPKAGIKELNASCRVGEVKAHLGHEIVSREGIFPGTTRYFNAAGKSHVNVHVTAGEVDVVLTQ